MENRIHNEGDSTILDVTFWTFDSKGQLLRFAATGDDHRYFIFLPAHTVKKFPAAEGVMSDDDPETASMIGRAGGTQTVSTGHGWENSRPFALMRLKTRSSPYAVSMKIWCAALWLPSRRGASSVHTVRSISSMLSLTQTIDRLTGPGAAASPASGV